MKGEMRIIGGYLKGQKLTPPKSDRVRPTIDRVKEAIFNIIQEWEDKVILDLFAGTGNLGIEAYSRGAKTVYFVDNDINSIMVVTENLKKFDLLKKSKIYSMDYKAALKKFGREGVKFDVIFIDPPFKKDFWEPALNLIVENHLLNDNGFIVTEIPTYKETKIPDSLTIYRDRKYGQNRLLILSGD